MIIDDVNKISVSHDLLDDLEKELEDIIVRESARIANEFDDKMMEGLRKNGVWAARWIPCSERMPEESGEYFATYINHNPEVYYEHIKGVPLTAPVVYYHDTWFWWSSVCLDMLKEYGESHVDDIDGAIEITAWMPLPEPWKENDVPQE